MIEGLIAITVEERKKKLLIEGLIAITVEERKKQLLMIFEKTTYIHLSGLFVSLIFSNLFSVMLIMTKKRDIPNL